jgi:hypothetical protein
MTVIAADLAGKLVVDRLVGGVVPFEVVVAGSEVNIILAENCGPLERCS